MPGEVYKRWHKPDMSPKAKTKQGYARIKHPEKYVGDPNLIIYRSTWEYAFIKYCDSSPSVKRWSSEPVSIPYYDRVSKLEECHRLGLNPNDPANWEVKHYHMDFWVEMDKGNDKVEKIFIEIKPAEKLKKPIPPPKDATIAQHKKFNKAAKEYLINEAKFAAAQEFAKKNNAKFYVFTEHTLERILGRIWYENNPKKKK